MIRRAIVAILFLVACVPIANGQSFPPAVGTVHPEFVFPSVEDDSPVQLSTYRGKKVLLVHFASW